MGWAGIAGGAPTASLDSYIAVLAMCAVKAGVKERVRADAEGNTTADGTYSYTWNGENRLSTTAGATYTYDGDGRRVKKSSGTLYCYGAGAVPLAETDLSGNTANEYIFFAGERIARRDGSGNVYYYFSDHLGSSRAIAVGNGGNAGTLCFDADFYPFGGHRPAYVDTCSQNYKFAGMERVSETGNDHTFFRYYASNLGRWLSPDPVAGSIYNPQSLNRYAYVLNNPMNFIDPLGLDEEVCTSMNGQPLGCTTTPGPPPDPVSLPSAPWDDPFRGGSGISGGGVGGKFPPRYQSTDTPRKNGPLGSGLGRTAPQAQAAANLWVQEGKDLVVWSVCGDSPQGAVLSWMMSGAIKGTVTGAVAGGFSGTIFGEVVGAPFGIILGGITGGTIGAGAGVYFGSAAAVGCSLAGVYGR